MNVFKRAGRRIGNWLQQKTSKISTIVAVSTFGGVIWPEAKYDVYAKETYLRNIIAFRCINIIAMAISSVIWKMVQADDDGEFEDMPEHPLMQLIKRPNPNDSFSFLMLQIASYLVMSGNCFIERVSLSTGPNVGIPKELYVLRPDRMAILVDEKSGAITGYKYTIGGRDVKWEVNPDGSCDILHIKLFHPLDDWYGAAITETARYEIDTSNAETEWNKKLLDNECRPGMIFRYKGNLGDQQFDRLEKQLNDKFSGSKNAGKNLILEGEDMPDAKPYGFSPTEMDFLEGGREKARRIALAYGVPPMMLGIPGDNTYSNYKEARQALWEDTIFFYLGLIKDELNNWMLKTDTEKYILNYCLDEIPALAPKREALWDKLQNASWLTINEKRNMAGMETVEGGDVLLVPATMMPLDMAGQTDTGSQNEEAVRQEEEEAIQKMIGKGYTREQAEGMIGLAPKKGNGNGQSKNTVS